MAKVKPFATPDGWIGAFWQYQGEDGTTALQPTGCSGIIPTKNEFMEMVRKAEVFYQLVSDEEIRFHNSQIRKRSEEPIVHPPKSKKCTAGYVYLLHSGGYYKIGLSANPDRRITEIQPKLPFEVEVIAMLETEDMFGLEETLHKAFSHRRLNGEWFELDEADIEYIKGLGA